MLSRRIESRPGRQEGRDDLKDDDEQGRADDGRNDVAGGVGQAGNGVVRHEDIEGKAVFHACRRIPQGGTEEVRVCQFFRIPFTPGCTGSQ